MAAERHTDCTSANLPGRTISNCGKRAMSSCLSKTSFGMLRGRKSFGVQTLLSSGFAFAVNTVTAAREALNQPSNRFWRAAVWNSTPVWLNCFSSCCKEFHLPAGPFAATPVLAVTADICLPTPIDLCAASMYVKHGFMRLTMSVSSPIARKSACISLIADG